MTIDHMELKVTADMMLSDDYKERFKAEYWQTKIRYERLKKYNNRIEAADMMHRSGPPHDCPSFLLNEQQEIMGRYLHLLEVRAEIEEIEL